MEMPKDINYYECGLDSASKEKYTDIRQCDVCDKITQVYVCCVPSVHISMVYCRECLNANAHPWGILVANTACCGGLENTIEEWQDMVKDTCKHLNRTLEEFNEDVKQSIIDINDY
jgi:hypothetical protein